MSETSRNIPGKNGCHCRLVQQCEVKSPAKALLDKPAVAPNVETLLDEPAVAPKSSGTCFFRRAVGTTVAVCCLIPWGLGATLAFGQSSDQLETVATWKPPSAEQVRAEVMKWLDGQDVEEETKDEVSRLWPEDSEGNGEATAAKLFDRLVRSFAVVDGKARRLLDQCSGPLAGPVPPEADWLADPQTDPLMAANLRLLYGRWLANQRLLDEAREQFADLEPEQVVDPATLLFYQAVVCQGLLEREAGLAAVKRLLERAQEGPRRYAEIGRLLKRDLETIEVDSLDHVARRMNDVSRRLDLGRAGPDVRKIEDGVIESLDKLIEKVKKQQQQQQKRSSQSAQNIQPSSPADDSRGMGGKGPGEVTKKDIGSQANWGDLPPKQRQEALQQIGREFPAHYRDVIEQYFRKMAKED